MGSVGARHGVPELSAADELTGTACRAPTCCISNAKVNKWLVFVKILWEKSSGVLSECEVDALKQFCNEQDFHSALNLALVTGLIEHPPFRRIDRIRSERNDMIHQCCLFTHRRNRRVLRARLEGLVSIADDLFAVFNHLLEQTGIDDSYDIFKVRRGKRLVV